MSYTKKFIIFTFIVGLVINLKLNSSIHQNTYNSFNLEQLAEKIFVSEAYASLPQNVCVLAGCRGGDLLCAEILYGKVRIICFDFGS